MKNSLYALLNLSILRYAISPLGDVTLRIEEDSYKSKTIQTEAFISKDMSQKT